MLKQILLLMCLLVPLSASAKGESFYLDLHGGHNFTDLELNFDSDIKGEYDTNSNLLGFNLANQTTDNWVLLLEYEGNPGGGYNSSNLGMAYGDIQNYVGFKAFKDTHSFDAGKYSANGFKFVWQNTIKYKKLFAGILMEGIVANVELAGVDYDMGGIKLAPSVGYRMSETETVKLVYSITKHMSDKDYTPEQRENEVELPNDVELGSHQISLVFSAVF